MIRLFWSYFFLHLGINFSQSIKTPMSCQDFVNNIDCSWKDSKPTSIQLASQQSCSFNCSYSPHEHAIELDVHLLTSVNDSKVFVSVHQNYGVSSWTLPITFPKDKFNLIYNTIDAILCPPLESQHDTLFFDIITRPLHDKQTTNISIFLKPQQLSIKLGARFNVTLTVTPVSPWYKLYQWNSNEKSVLVTADSIVKKNEVNICTLLSLQDNKCPLGLTKEKIIAGPGRYQTFQAKGAMIARRDIFPNGIFIVVLTLPDDSLCTSKSEGLNKNSRQKSVRLSILPHKTFEEHVFGYVGVFIFLLFIIGGSSFIIVIFIQRNLNPQHSHAELCNEDLDLLSRDTLGQGDISAAGVQLVFEGISNEVEHDDFHAQGTGSSSTQGDRQLCLPAPSHGVEERLMAIMEGRCHTPRIEDASPVVSVPSDESLPNRVLNFTSQRNPRYVFWWKIWREFKDQSADSNLGSVGFQRNLILIAIFMALPFSEILKSYTNVFNNRGSEDECFFNSKCLISFGIFADFSRIFTNIPYVLCGLFVVYIVKRHYELTQQLTVCGTLGVNRNTGLFFSLGLGLIIQGIMSSMYHVCPNRVTLRLDMMFMYVDAVVMIVGIWGFRHGSVSDHVYPTVGFVGLALLGAELEEDVSPGLFWTIASIIHISLTCMIATMIHKYGTWSFSPMDMFRITKEWKPILDNLNQVLQEERPTGTSIIMCSKFAIGIGMNLAIVIVCFSLQVEVYMYILIVCIGNMIMYIMNYIFHKLWYKEKGNGLSWITLVLSALLWVPSITFFFLKNTDIEATPSQSRALNSPCVLLDIFDYHDLWHIFSALAMFYMLVGVLTLDDDLVKTNPQKIPVF